MNCEKCNGSLVVRLTPECIHHGRLECSQCGKHIKFISKPENEGKRRDKNSSWRKHHKEKGFICGICGANESHYPNSSQWDLDHIVQLSDGGKDELENTMMLCTFCHTIKNSEQKRRQALEKNWGE